MQEACGEYAALLDGDDTWEPGYLAEIERLIAAYPGCGAYATSFNVDDGHHLTPGDTPQRRVSWISSPKRFPITC